MEISAISAVSPKQIDWRKLTAKEIIKYDQQGVEVPGEYLQWAKQFQADIKSAENDDTTYEMAVSAGANVATANISANAEQDVEGDEEKLTAAQRRDKMLQDGENYYKVAKVFSAESVEKAAQSEDSSSRLSEIGSISDVRTQTLESEIDTLMTQADELKAQINSLKTQKSTSGLGNIIQIKHLERQLKSLGIQGQTMAGAVDSDLNEYKSDIGSQDELNSGNIEHGSVTMEMGDRIKSIFWFHAAGVIIERNGKKAVEKGQDAQDIGKEIQQKNNSNLVQVRKLESQIAAKTGASAASSGSAKNNEEDGSDADKKDSANQSESEQTKDIAAMGNMNEILQYKIRKGEEVST
ncbi:MAG: hypothetical protein NC191_02500 [Muribaculaceae bacterium]|nr:hypothetical protein [Muribaculaceae bacterium]